MLPLKRSTMGVDNGVPSAIRRGLDDLRHCLHLELERLEAQMLESIVQLIQCHASDEEQSPSTPGSPQKTRRPSRQIDGMGLQGLQSTEPPRLPQPDGPPEPPNATETSRVDHMFQSVSEPPPPKKPEEPSEPPTCRGSHKQGPCEELRNVAELLPPLQSWVTDASPGSRSDSKEMKSTVTTMTTRYVVSEAPLMTAQLSRVNSDLRSEIRSLATSHQAGESNFEELTSQSRRSESQTPRTPRTPRTARGRKNWLYPRIGKVLTWQYDEAAHIARSEEMEKEKFAMMASQSTRPVQHREANRFATLINHQYFELFFCVMIMVSALAYGVEVQWMASHVGDQQPMIFFFMNQYFTVLFLMELFVRMAAEGIHGYVCSKDNYVWAWFDIAICCSSVLESAVEITLRVLQNGGEDILSAGPLRVIRMIRVLRMSRALRLQRFIWFVTSLRTLVYSIAVTLKSLFWAMVLLLAIVFVFAMCFTQITIEYAVDPERDAQTTQEMLAYWGSLDRSMLTLFQSIAGGLSWREAALPMERVSVILLILFVLYISFVYFAVLNVVTGVFCSSAIETAKTTPELIARSLIDNKKIYEDHLKKLFKTIDIGETGLITLSEFERLRDDEMTVAYFRALEIDFADAWTIFKLIDADKGGALDMNEFVRGCQQLRGTASSLEMQDMSYDLRKLTNMVNKFFKHTDTQLEAIAARVDFVTDKADGRKRSRSRPDHPNM